MSCTRWDSTSGLTDWIALVKAGKDQDQNLKQVAFGSPIPANQYCNVTPLVKINAEALEVLPLTLYLKTVNPHWTFSVWSHYFPQVHQAALCLAPLVEAQKTSQRPLQAQPLQEVAQG